MELPETVRWLDENYHLEKRFTETELEELIQKYGIT